MTPSNPSDLTRSRLEYLATSFHPITYSKAKAVVRKEVAYDSDRSSPSIIVLDKPPQSGKRRRDSSKSRAETLPAGCQANRGRLTLPGGSGGPREGRITASRVEPFSKTIGAGLDYEPSQKKSRRDFENPRTSLLPSSENRLVPYAQTAASEYEDGKWDRRSTRNAKERAGASIKTLIDTTTASGWLEGELPVLTFEDKAGNDRDHAPSSASPRWKVDLPRYIAKLAPYEDAITAVRRLFQEAEHEAQCEFSGNEERALKLIASHDLQHFEGNDQCDHCQSPKKMFKHIPKDMQRLPCLGVMGRPCVLCTLLRSGCSFTGRAGGNKVAPVYANATTRSYRDEECTDIVRERQETAVSASRFTEAVDKRELEDIVEVIEVPSQSPSPLLVAAEPAKMYRAAEMTQSTKTDKPAEANKQAKTDMSVTITPSISPDTLCTALEDIQRHRRALWRKTVSTATFVMKVQPDIHSTGGITIDEVPDLMKEMIEEVDALKSMAKGIIDEVNEYQSGLRG